MDRPLPSAATDGDSTSKYLNHVQDGSATPGVNSGFVVTPKVGATILTGIIFTAANDVSDRDPMTFTIEGSNDANAFSEGAKGFTLIHEGKTGLDPGNPGTAVKFPNTGSYKTYRILITSVRNKSADGVQYGEVQFLGTVVPPLIPPVPSKFDSAPTVK